MSSGNPAVSFVIPTYNRAEFVGSAIGSVLHQDTDNWELIVVDDGSTDHTESVVKSFVDHRIKYIKTENNERGVARNKGVELALGKFVSFIDSDDFITPDTVRKAVKVTEQHPDWLVFHFGFEIRDEFGGLLKEAEKLPALTNELLKRRNVIGCHGIFIKREVLLENKFSKLRELSGTEDYELWIRLAARYPIHHINEVTSVLVQHEGRSMEDGDFTKVEKRILAFLRLAIADEPVREFLGSELSKFEADRISYISLHAALVGDPRMARFYLRSYVAKSPSLLFSRRTVSVLLNLYRQSRKA